MKKLTLFLVLFLFTCFSIKAQNRNIADSTFVSLDAALTVPDLVQHLVLQDDTLSNLDGIGQLINLKTLDIYNSAFKEIPQEISQLQNLKSLFITSCSEINWNEAFNSINTLTSLEVLILKNSNITEFPETVTDLVNLQHLDLSGNKITEFPTAIKNFTELKEIIILNNPNLRYSSEDNTFDALEKINNLHFTINEHNIKLLGAFSSIEELVISGEVKGELPEMNHLEKLKTIKLNDVHSPNYDSLFMMLAEAPALEKLLIYSDSLSFLPEKLNSLENLQTLFLQGKSFTSVVEDWCTLPNLKTISLNQSEVFNFEEFISNVAGLKKLDNINLKNNQISTIPDNIVLLNNKLDINLAENSINDLPKALTRMKNLKWLNLTNNPLKDNLVLTFMSYMPWCEIEFNLSPEYYQTETLVNNTSVFERIFRGEVQKNTLLIDAQQGGTIFSDDGITLKVKPNSFLLPDGTVYDKEVRIEIQQYSNPAEIFASGIPMFINDGDTTVALQSGGMLTFNAFADTIQLSPNPENLIDVYIPSLNRNTNMNLYRLSNNGWQQINTVAPPLILNGSPVAPEYPSFKGSLPPRIFNRHNYFTRPGSIFNLERRDTMFFKTSHLDVFVKTTINSEPNKTFMFFPNYRSPEQYSTQIFRANEGNAYPELNVLTRYTWKVVGNDAENIFKIIKQVQAYRGDQNSALNNYFRINGIELSEDSTYLKFDIKVVENRGEINRQLDCRPVYSTNSVEEIKNQNIELVSSYYELREQRLELWKQNDSLCMVQNFEIEKIKNRTLFMKNNYSYNFAETQMVFDSLYDVAVQQYYIDSVNYYQSDEFMVAKEAYDIALAQYEIENRAWEARYTKILENREVEIALRSFALQNFGTINCDYFYRVARPQIITSKFIDAEGNLITFQKAILFNESAVNYIEYPAGQEIKYDSQAVNSILLLLDDQKIAFVNRSEFRSINFTDEVVAEIYDLNNMTFSAFITDVYYGQSK